MEGNRKGQNLLIIALVVAVVAMSVGFAASSYTQALTISGSNVTAKAAKWDVHFDDSTYSETTGSVAATSHTLTGTTLTYAVTLEPGEFYEANATVVNEGTFNANLTGITLTGVSAEQAKYIKYSIFYNGTEYTTSTSNLTISLPKTTGTAAVKVRVEYYLPAQSSDLPATDQTITLSSTLSYVQAA